MSKVVPLNKFASELDKYAKKNMVVYKQTVVEVLVDTMQSLVELSPVDTGLFAQSWNLEVDEKRALLGNFAPHAPIIEFGARPFTPPIGPLLDWAKRVLQKPEIDSHCWALARYVQNKISIEGMLPRHLLSDGVDRAIEEIRSLLSQRLGKV